MNSEEIQWATAQQLATAVASDDVSCIEIATAMVERIEEVNPRINAYVVFDAQQVIDDAAALDARRASGELLGPLHGVPYSIKDLTTMDGLPLTLGLKPRLGEVGTKDEALVTKLRGAGGLFLGKTNAPELGYYGGTDNHVYGPTHNPWRQGYSAGGSSGGAAAAVATGMGPLSQGSDGAGSIRIPAAHCGVVGFKPSMGRVPHSLLEGRFHSWAYAGPITRTVGDTALMLDVIAGHSSADPLSLPDVGFSYADSLDRDLTGLRVAWSPTLGIGHVDPEVARVCAEAVGTFEQLGATVVEATPPWQDLEQTMWDAIWLPGYAPNVDLIDWASASGQVDDHLIEIMRQAASFTGAQLGRADNARGRIYDAYMSFMNDYDLLVSPTLASTAFPLEQFAPQWLAESPLRTQLLGWLLTYPYNMITNPAISVPAGLSSDGLPVGLQIAGGHHADLLVLQAAAQYERARPWSDLHPPL